MSGRRAHVVPFREDRIRRTGFKKLDKDLNSGARFVSPEDEKFIFNQRFLHLRRPEFWMVLVVATSMLILSALSYVDEFKWSRSSEVFMTRTDWIVYTAIFLGVSLITMIVFYVIRKERLEDLGNMAWDHWYIYQEAMAITVVYYAILMAGSLTPPSSQCDSNGRCRPWIVIIGLAFGLILFAVSILSRIIAQELYLRKVDYRGHQAVNRHPHIKRAARNAARRFHKQEMERSFLEHRV